MTELTERERTILVTVVALFLRDGEPVSSASVQAAEAVSVSTATIRNTMKRLEERGFLEQPHTSAGRVPTPTGLRVFVDSLPNRRTAREPFTLQSDTMRTAVSEAAELLSARTHLAALAVGPKFEQSRIREMTLVPVSDTKVLVVIVTDSSEVFERLVTTEADIARTRLMEIQNVLNSTCEGKTLSELRREMRRGLSDVRTAYREMISAASRIADQLTLEAKPEILVENSTSLFGFEELTQNMERMKTLMMTLEAREQLVEILDALETSASASVFIGPEIGALGDDLSLVLCGYTNDDEPAGLIGVLGPLRMDYKRLIPLVDQAARMLSINNENNS